MTQPKPHKRKEVIGNCTLYLGDYQDILPTLDRVDAVVTDPPYPNRAGHFNSGVMHARRFLYEAEADHVISFWDHMEFPERRCKRIAVHIWHRTNVNGTPYEAIHEWKKGSKKSRSEVFQHPAVFYGAGPGCNEYEGHPTQKPINLMEKLIKRTQGVVIDPFMGSGTTGVACAKMGRSFIGIEISEDYFQIACERIEDAYRQADMFVEDK